MLNFLTDMMNSCSRRWLGADRNVTAVFNDVDSGSQGDLVAAQAGQIMLFSGQTTLNDIQEKAGRPSFEMPEADEPFIVTGNTIQFLNGLLAQDAAGEVTGQVQNGQSNGQGQEEANNGEEQVNSKQPEDDEQLGNGGQAAPPDVAPKTDADKSLNGDGPYSAIDAAELVYRRTRYFQPISGEAQEGG